MVLLAYQAVFQRFVGRWINKSMDQQSSEIVSSSVCVTCCTASGRIYTGMEIIRKDGALVLESLLCVDMIGWGSILGP